MAKLTKEIRQEIIGLLRSVDDEGEMEELLKEGVLQLMVLRMLADGVVDSTLELERQLLSMRDHKVARSMVAEVGMRVSFSYDITLDDLIIIGAVVREKTRRGES